MENLFILKSDYLFKELIHERLTYWKLVYYEDYLC